MSNFAETGFEAHYGEKMATSHIGPLILAIFAFFIFAQGLMYLLRPDMTARALTIPTPKLRRFGFYITVLSGFMLYVAFSWWTGGW